MRMTICMCTICFGGIPYHTVRAAAVHGTVVEGICNFLTRFSLPVFGESSLLYRIRNMNYTVPAKRDVVCCFLLCRGTCDTSHTPVAGCQLAQGCPARSLSAMSLRSACALASRRAISAFLARTVAATSGRAYRGQRARGEGAEGRDGPHHPGAAQWRARAEARRAGRGRVTTARARVAGREPAWARRAPPRRLAASAQPRRARRARRARRGHGRHRAHPARRRATRAHPARRRRRRRHCRRRRRWWWQWQR